MRLEDLILVSVDDHVVEPPDVFEHHLPKKYADIAPRIVHNEDGTDVWKFLDINIPNVGLNAVAGRPPDEYGMDPTSFDEIPNAYGSRRRCSVARNAVTSPNSASPTTAVRVNPAARTCRSKVSAWRHFS